MRTHGITLFPNLYAGAWVTLAHEPVALRRALNAVVRELPETVWQVSSQHGGYSPFVTAVEQAT